MTNEELKRMLPPGPYSNLPEGFELTKDNAKTLYHAMFCSFFLIKQGVIDWFNENISKEDLIKWSNEYIENKITAFKDRMNVCLKTDITRDYLSDLVHDIYMMLRVYTNDDAVINEIIEFLKEFDNNVGYFYFGQRYVEDHQFPASGKEIFSCNWPTSDLTGWVVTLYNEHKYVLLNKLLDDICIPSLENYGVQSEIKEKLNITDFYWGLKNDFSEFKNHLNMYKEYFKGTEFEHKFDNVAVKKE